MQVRARGRVAGALACAYCRDGIARTEAVACESPACGAVYHVACWEECRTDYGACAVIGCGGSRVRALGRTARWLRLARLLLAALLFPPRLARGLRERQGQAASETVRWAWGIGRRTLPSWNERENGAGKLLIYMATSVPVSVAVVLGALRLHVVRLSSLTGPDQDGSLLVLGALVVAANLVAPMLITLLLLLGVTGARGLARLLARELAALGRADAPGGVVARMARPQQKK